MKIGVTSDVNLTPTSVQRDKEAQLVPKNVIKVLEKNDALPIIFPITKDKFIPSLVESVDGIILTGGVDVCPGFYGEHPLSAGDLTYRPRDKFEINLVKEAIKRNKPILGLCRGEQIVNVTLGGSLYQNLETQLNQKETLEHQQEVAGYLPTHHVKIKEKSKLSDSLNHEQFVNSRHHQAVKTLGKGLKVDAYASDGVIEGIENHDGSIIGVQWHPEDLWQNNSDQEDLFKDFIKRCGKNNIKLESHVG